MPVRRVPPLPGDAFEDEPKGGQALAEIVVQIAGNPAPLLFLRHDQAPQQADPHRLGLGTAGNLRGEQGLRFRELRERSRRSWTPTQARG